MSDLPFTTHGDEALEARIVAWVLGEVSAFEAAELERLCDERPELMVFKRRIAVLNGMLAEAESAKPDESWKLPPEKRNAVEDVPGKQSGVGIEGAREKRLKRSGRRAMLVIAACLVLLVVVAGTSRDNTKSADAAASDGPILTDGRASNYPDTFEPPTSKTMAPAPPAALAMPAQMGLAGVDKPMRSRSAKAEGMLLDTLPPMVETSGEDVSNHSRLSAAGVAEDFPSLLEEIPAEVEPYSTFSLNISDASFRMAQAALAKGEQPDPAGIKVEQFYNAVDYGDPAPVSNEPVACAIGQVAHPLIPGRNLVRVALKTAAAAEDVKVQVRFNPERVARYKLIGFEKDRLKTGDFRNDKVDAAELAAVEAGVAIYQVEPLPEGRGEIGGVSVRFRNTAAGEMVERSWTIPYDPAAPALDRAMPSMQLATLAMLAAEKLKGGPLGEAVDFRQFAEAQAEVKAHYSGNTRVAGLLRMIEMLK